MDFAQVFPGKVEFVARWEDPRECREIVAAGLPAGVVLACVTQGELTAELYDAPWHVGCACVRGEHVPALVRLLGGPCGDGAGEAGDLSRVAEAASAFFASEEVYFSDALDALDAAHIPYSYRDYTSYAALFRDEWAA